MAEPGRALLRRPALAEEAGLDLVEIAPNSTPPVCKILDYGKYRFLEQKKAGRSAQEAEDRRGQGDQAPPRHRRPRLRRQDEGHEGLLRGGQQGQDHLRFRGREMAHQGLGLKVLDRVKSDVGDLCQGREGAELRGPPGRDGAGAALTGRDAQQSAFCRPGRAKICAPAGLAIFAEGLLP